MVFVVPVVCAADGTPGAAVGAVGKAPGAPGTPVVRGSPPRPPGAVGAPGPPPGSVVVGVVGETIPCEIDCTISVAKSLARAFRNGTIRSSLTALETVLSMRSIRPRISSRSEGAAWTKTVLVLSSEVIRIWFRLRVSVP